MCKPYNSLELGTKAKYGKFWKFPRERLLDPPPYLQKCAKFAVEIKNL